MIKCLRKHGKWVAKEKKNQLEEPNNPNSFSSWKASRKTNRDGEIGRLVHTNGQRESKPKYEYST
jgi:hypothetical protein